MNFLKQTLTKQSVFGDLIQPTSLGFMTIILRATKPTQTGHISFLKWTYQLLSPYHTFGQLNPQAKGSPLHPILTNFFSNNINFSVIQKVAPEHAVSVLKSQLKLLCGENLWAVHTDSLAFQKSPLLSSLWVGLVIYALCMCTHLQLWMFI